MTTEPIFEIRTSAARRALLRVIIISSVSIAIILWGRSLLPDDFTLMIEPKHVSLWSGWVFFGVVLIGTGIFNLTKEILFGLRSLGKSGEWYFRLDNQELIWDVPDHAHGPEIGFRAKLSEIKEIEFRTVQEFDEFDKREYWVHFHDRYPIELQFYTGTSPSWLVEKICSTGVAYRETTIQK